MRPLICAIAAVSSLIPLATTHAFEIGPYRDGMVLEQVISIAGAGLKQSQNDPNIYLQSSKAGGKVTAVFTFCHRLLSVIDTDIGGFTGFVSQAKRLTSEFGEPVVTTIAQGSRHDLGLKWSDGSGEFTSLALVSEFGASVPTASATYDASVKVCTPTPP